MLCIDIVYTMKQRDDGLIDTFTQVMADDQPELGESKKKIQFFRSFVIFRFNFYVGNLRPFDTDGTWCTHSSEQTNGKFAHFTVQSNVK